MIQRKYPLLVCGRRYRLPGRGTTPPFGQKSFLANLQANGVGVGCEAPHDQCILLILRMDLP